MDLRALSPYVAVAMGFLLVLSAVLSAVTGVFIGAPEAGLHRQAPAQFAQAAETAEQAVLPAARIAAPSPSFASGEPVGAAERVAPPAAAPLDTDRLIE